MAGGREDAGGRSGAATVRRAAFLAGDFAAGFSDVVAADFFADVFRAGAAEAGAGAAFFLTGMEAGENSRVTPIAQIEIVNQGNYPSLSNSRGARPVDPFCRSRQHNRPPELSRLGSSVLLVQFSCGSGNLGLQHNISGNGLLPRNQCLPCYFAVKVFPGGDALPAIITDPRFLFVVGPVF